MIGPVEHGKVLEIQRLRAAARTLASAQALHPGHHTLGLVLLAVGVQHAHRFALTELAPKVLDEQFRIGTNHIVGGAQDGAGGAVVLLQLDDLERREVDRQLLQVVQRGTAPAVNRLIVVTHRGKACLLCRLARHQQL